MTSRRLVSIAALAVALGLLFALAACGPKTESAAPGPSAEPAPDVAYTVLTSELDNPDNKPVYVCPMKEHREQVSLDPDARCSLCNMKLVALEEAKKTWAESEE